MDTLFAFNYGIIRDLKNFLIGKWNLGVKIESFLIYYQLRNSLYFMIFTFEYLKLLKNCQIKIKDEKKYLLINHNRL